MQIIWNVTFHFFLGFAFLKSAKTMEGFFFTSISFNFLAIQGRSIGTAVSCIFIGKHH